MLVFLYSDQEDNTIILLKCFQQIYGLMLIIDSHTCQHETSGSTSNITIPTPPSK